MRRRPGLHAFTPRLRNIITLVASLVVALLHTPPARGEVRPLSLAVDVSLGRAGFGKLDFTEAEESRLEADGIGVQAGLGLMQRRGYLRWGVGLDTTLAAGGSGTSVQCGLDLHVGFTSRYLEVIAGSGIGMMWITDRQQREHVDLAIPVRIMLGVRLTRTLALVPQAAVYFGRRALGAFIGGGLQWIPGA